MSIRSVLVPILPQCEPAPMLNAGLQLARRFGGHLDALFIRPDPADAFAAIPNFALAERVTLEEVEEAGRQLGRAAHERFEHWRAATMLIDGMPPAGTAVPTTWCERVGAIETELPDRGRLSDLIVLHYPTHHVHGSERLFTAATFSTGRPVLLVRHAIAHDLLNHVLIAWNGGLEATRAVAAAMPLLEAAKSVTVFTAPMHGGAPECGVSLGDALARHGIQSQQTWAHRNDPDVGASLLRAASERGASLIVMGAQNHSRLLTALFGGVTRHVLKEGGLAVLMAH
ncbi:MAG TPA: universal stress protein [Aliidongia sp.]|nr:universal stress protein [Aliidongia sp.]